MRTLVRPLLLFAVLCGFTIYSQSIVGAQPPIHTFIWTDGFPMSQVGGVDVSVDLGPAPGWSCKTVTLMVIDDATSKTLGEYEKDNPGAVASNSFGGLPNRVKVRITGEAVFENMGQFDVKQIQTYTTTK